MIRLAATSQRDPVERARSVLRRHLVATSALVVGIMLSMLVAEWALTRRAADRMAEQVSTRVARTVSELVTGADFGDEGQSHTALDERIRSFLEAGTIVRIKVWMVEGDQVRVVYSDDPRTEGTVRAFSSDLARRLDAGETVVLPVPDDAEHQFESALGMDLREAFIGFVDRAGNQLRLEVYVPVQSRELTANALIVQAPVIGVGLVLLVVVLSWGSLSLAGQLKTLAEQRHRAVLYGLRSREEERTGLAQRLHDGVVQSLAGSRLALDSIRGRTATDDALLRRVAEVLGDDTRALRELLAEYVAVSGAATLASDLQRLADAAGTPRVDVRVVPGVQLDDESAGVIRRAAEEGVRNARSHACAARVQVSLEPRGGGAELAVVDDGRGMASASEAETGHVGLALVGSAVRSVGGRLSLESPATGGTTLRIWLPSPAAGDPRVPLPLP